jgi:hypothetical protein
MLFIFGTDGLTTRNELFDSERDDEALARFDELVLSPADEPTAEPPATRFANAASRAVERFERCWRDRDWDGTVASFAPTLVLDDRRALFHLQVAG